MNRTETKPSTQPCPKFIEGDSMQEGPEGDPDSICLMCEETHHQCRCPNE
jgi:hypothetical protein